MEQKQKTNFPTSQYQDTFIQRLFSSYEELNKQGLEANQMFMIMFQESVSQSIKSSAGVQLEALVERHFINEGIKKTEKKIDARHHDIEYDHFFHLENKTYGFSTKRTMRERYKQFKKTQGAEADVFIHITSGLDLNKAKADTITSQNFGCYIFVFPEIYEITSYLHENPRIFSTTKLTKDVLLTLS